MTTQFKEKLASIYYDPKHPASFSSVNNLYKAVKVPGVTKEDVKDWLASQITYTLHKPKRKSFKRNPVIVSFIDEQWQADLVDMQAFSRVNKGYKYIITAIDIFSKYAFAVPIKSKTMTSVTEGFKKMIAKRQPCKLQTDQGLEFENSMLKKMFTENCITFFTTRNKETKCSVVERFNRTLRGRMFRYFTKTGKRVYHDVLDKLIAAYNMTVHSTTKMKPALVTNDNTQKVFKNTYGVPSLRDLHNKMYRDKPKFKKGDQVRIAYEGDIYSKGYYPGWTDHVYTVDKAIKGPNRSLYELKNYQNNLLEGKFYPEEVQKVYAETYRVEKIVKRRIQNGVREVFVKWLNYPSTDNSWIPEADVEDM